MIFVTSFLSTTEEVALSYRSVSSRKVSKPQFSIAPAWKSGIATKSGHNRKKTWSTFLHLSHSRLNQSILPTVVARRTRRQWVRFVPLMELPFLQPCMRFTDSSTEEDPVKPLQSHCSSVPSPKKETSNSFPMYRDNSLRSRTSFMLNNTCFPKCPLLSFYYFNQDFLRK